MKDDQAVPAQAQVTDIRNDSDLAELFDRSFREPVLLFKHDPYCGTSLSARDEMTDVERNIAIVDVARSHDLGQTIATVTGVRHESPQIIILRNGRARWSASHYSIQAERVRQEFDATTE